MDKQKRAEELFRDQVMAARRSGVPILVVTTADQWATERELVKCIDENRSPAFRWDAVRGLQPITKLAREDKDARMVTTGDATVPFAEALVALETTAPRGTLVVMHNAHRQLQAMEPGAIAASVQGVANLREAFKANFRMLVLMAPHMPVPTELDQDVIVLDHALPDTEALGEIVSQVVASGKLPKPKAEVLDKAVDALSGLSAFAAEQVTAMSLTKDGVQLDALWERKRQAIERAPGLSVWRGGERFDDLVGLDSIKQHLTNRAQSRTPVGVVLFLDEIDKVFANVEGDTTGTRMDQFRTMLAEMENNEWRGLVAVGVPGAGKSAIAKAFGNEVGVPTIAVDLGGMENKFVGESEANMRNFIRIAKAVGRGHAYVIATSNNATIMRPELQRRFTDGMWFFDLMSEAERVAAWRAYTTKYGLTGKAAERPDDTGWTGAEIRNCARYAWDTRCTLKEAARFIVPMSRSRGREIEALRQYAHGKFLDASRPGSYQYDKTPMAEQLRAIDLTEVPVAGKVQ